MQHKVPPPTRKRFRISPTRFGGYTIAIISLFCFGSLLFGAMDWYNVQILNYKLNAPGLNVTNQETEKTEAVKYEMVVDSEGNTETKTSTFYNLMGTDQLGRSLFWRCLMGGVISLGIGLTAAGISVIIGTLWGLVSGYMGGKVDSTMMRIVDILYGLPYILLVLLLVVAIDGMLSRVETNFAEYQKPTNAKTNAGKEPSEDLKQERIEYAKLAAKWETAKAVSESERETLQTLEHGSPAYQKQLELVEELQAEAEDLNPTPFMLKLIRNYPNAVNLVPLLVAIGSISWLTLARVVRGQVLSLKAQPFVEAARAIGSPTHRILFRHILPNLVGPIIVYTALMVPQAILQESFLSFLGIGVKPPMPSWGNLAAEGLKQLNPVLSRSWLLVFPCVLLGMTLLALNFLGDGLRDYYDPKAKQNR